MPSARSRTARRAAVRRAAGGTTSSTSPDFNARVAFTDLPVRIRSRPAARPTSRGSRCVPPMPGMIPRLTSGTPSTVLGSSEAMRYRQHRTVSSPPPRQDPWIAATTGTRAASSRPRTPWADRDSVSPSRALRMAVNSLMSAPAMKLSVLPLRNTTPFTSGRASRSVMRASSSSITGRPIVFTFSPGTSSVTTSTPSDRISWVSARAVAGTAFASTALAGSLTPPLPTDACPRSDRRCSPPPPGPRGYARRGEGTTGGSPPACLSGGWDKPASPGAGRPPAAR